MDDPMTRAAVVGVDMTVFMDDIAEGEANKAVNDGHPAGDCMRASVATILGRKLDDVPHFAQYIEHPAGTDALWWWSLVGFLHHVGYEIEAHPADDPPMGWSLVDGYSPRGHRHLCVGRDGEVAFDPHPSRDGMRTIVGWWAVWKREDDADVMSVVSCDDEATAKATVGPGTHGSATP